MKCPQCGAWSTVLDTRAGPSETVKRRRECANAHRFFTFEMIAPARNPGSMRRALYTVAERRARWERDQAVRRNTEGLSLEGLAAKHGLSVKTIRKLRQ